MKCFPELSVSSEKDIALSNCFLCYSLPENMVLVWAQLMTLPV